MSSISNYWWLGLDRLAMRLSRLVLFLWVRVRVQPESFVELASDSDAAVCYALETRALSDYLVVDDLCHKHAMPPPGGGLRFGLLEQRHALIWLREPGRRWLRRGVRPQSEQRLQEMIAALRRDHAGDIRIIPVAVFWGRSPDRKGSFTSVMLSDSWRRGSRLKRLLAIVFYGRNTFVQFSAPVSLREFAAQALDDKSAARKLARLLRVHFTRSRTAVIGPDLSHRYTMLDGLLRRPALRQAIDSEARDHNITTARATRQARRYLEEIAADYSYLVIRLLEHVLGSLWNRIYNGVDVRHLDTLRNVAAGNEIIYLPCHRSHFDYLLLSYIVHEAGLVPPHIAAGVNLNLPLIGPILRRGGAFFLRRTFRDNPLYAVAFTQYLEQMLSRGFSVEYFVEGGRSRTGRLLQPKPGMLSMTVGSFLHNPERPIVLLPVYIGYEKIFEGRSYVRELSGQPKRKESMGGFVKALRSLRGNFGKVRVSFGEPIHLDAFLDRYAAGWRDGDQQAAQAEWLPAVVRRLGRQVLTNINASADVNPVNLLALVLLATPRLTLGEEDLANQLELYVRLLKINRYSERITVTDLSGGEMIAYGESLGVIKRQGHALGDLLVLEGEQAILMSFFRNNILHLFALPSFVAVCFLNNDRLTRERIIEFGQLAYPFVRGELFLRWSSSDFPDAVSTVMDSLQTLGLLHIDPRSGKLCARERGGSQSLALSLLAQAVLQTFERFYITGALLVRRGSGVLTRDDLETLCHLTAQRLALLYGFRAPDFFDKALFAQFIDRLKRSGLLSEGDDGRLHYLDAVQSIYDDARLILSRPVRHSIDQMAGIGAVPAPAPAAEST